MRHAGNQSATMVAIRQWVANGQTARRQSCPIGRNSAAHGRLGSPQNHARRGFQIDKLPLFCCPDAAGTPGGSPGLHLEIQSRPCNR
jgi:hypothetical protein